MNTLFEINPINEIVKDKMNIIAAVILVVCELKNHYIMSQVNKLELGSIIKFDPRIDKESVISNSYKIINSLK